MRLLRYSPYTRSSAGLACTAILLRSVRRVPVPERRLRLRDDRSTPFLRIHVANLKPLQQHLAAVCKQRDVKAGEDSAQARVLIREVVTRGANLPAGQAVFP